MFLLCAGKDNITRIVIITVVVIVGFAVLLLILVCIFKKKPKQRTDTATFQSKFCVAKTKNFCEFIQPLMCCCSVTQIPIELKI